MKLALDDFGTGYSSLSYVRRFSLDMLKIDKSFIDGIDSSPEDRAIVEHIVGMAAALGMVTVAEGVERPEQLQWLRRLGCKLAQGYVMSRPVPGEDFEAILERHEIDPFHITTGELPEVAAPAITAPKPDFIAPKTVAPANAKPASANPATAPAASPASDPFERASSRSMVGPLEFLAPETPAEIVDDGPSVAHMVGAAVGSDDLADPVPVANPVGSPTLPRLREYRPADGD